MNDEKKDLNNGWVPVDSPEGQALLKSWTASGESPGEVDSVRVVEDELKKETMNEAKKTFIEVDLDKGDLEAMASEFGAVNQDALDAVAQSTVEVLNMDPLITMERGVIDGVRIIESESKFYSGDTPHLSRLRALLSQSPRTSAEEEEPAQGGDDGEDYRRERMGNNKKVVSKALKKKRLKIAQASKRKNRGR